MTKRDTPGLRKLMRRIWASPAQRANEKLDKLDAVRLNLENHSENSSATEFRGTLAGASVFEDSAYLASSRRPSLIYSDEFLRAETLPREVRGGLQRHD